MVKVVFVEISMSGATLLVIVWILPQVSVDGESGEKKKRVPPDIQRIPGV